MSMGKHSCWALWPHPDNFPSSKLMANSSAIKEVRTAQVCPPDLRSEGKGNTCQGRRDLSLGGE